MKVAKKVWALARARSPDGLPYAEESRAPVRFEQYGQAGRRDRGKFILERLEGALGHAEGVRYADLSNVVGCAEAAGCTSPTVAWRT